MVSFDRVRKSSSKGIPRSCSPVCFENCGSPTRNPTTTSEFLETKLHLGGDDETAYTTPQEKRIQPHAGGAHRARSGQRHFWRLRTSHACRGRGRTGLIRENS